MRASQPSASVHRSRAIDLSAVRAVGFDLDHTLALYDDHAVNLLAADETASLLVESGGYPSASVSLVPDPIAAARGLSLDLRHGNVVKFVADGRVALARHGRAWLTPNDIDARYRLHDPADPDLAWHIHSPFDVPTLWFYAAMAPGVVRATGAGRRPDPARLLRDIRATLDHSHTRGTLKTTMTAGLDRFVRPAGSAREGLERWKQAGKQLFVVTNSDRAFATAVLDAALGPGWDALFDLVVTDARKPGFFATDAGPARRAGVRRRNGTPVLERASAQEVETALGVPPHRVLYAGDNAGFDVAPARSRGWWTAHVVAELDAPDDASGWAGALDHHGTPTWFARVIRDHADIACARIDHLLGLDPHACLDPTSDFYTFAAVRRVVP